MFRSIANSAGRRSCWIGRLNKMPRIKTKVEGVPIRCNRCGSKKNLLNTPSGTVCKSCLNHKKKPIDRMIERMWNGEVGNVFK